MIYKHKQKKILHKKLKILVSKSNTLKFTSYVQLGRFIVQQKFYNQTTYFEHTYFS